MEIRPATENDLGFIYETFLRSFRAASTHAEGLDNAHVVRMLTNLLDVNGWRADVAEAENYLTGWIAYKLDRDNHLAWIYVREMFRGQGVGKKLLEEACINPTAGQIVTPFIPNRQKNRTWKFVHRPFEVVA